MAKPIRDPLHLRFIRSLPCCIGKNCFGRVEAAHTRPHGLGLKSSDLSAIPLCQRHHRTGDDSIHKLGPAVFQDIHEIRIAEILLRLTAKPRITVQGGCFVAELNQQTYLLGGTGHGLESALRQLRRIRYQEVVA